MENIQKSEAFSAIGRKLTDWYRENARDLPFRKTKDPYKIWICEIVFQQTRISQGIGHYNKFVARFPDVKTLAEADEDEVLLHWKGLGYYSRAINIHKAAQQIMNDFGGKFPSDYDDILKLKGVGKYTAAAVSSICFDGKQPAVDGNFYRVLSRIFADDFDISSSKAFAYFSQLAHLVLPENVGDFNQAMMDLGSEICKPRNPLCAECPVNDACLAFNLNKIADFPVKLKKAKTTDLHLKYYFIRYTNLFAIRQRKDDFIWKKLYEFPDELPEEFQKFVNDTVTVKHKLTHKNLTIEILEVILNSENELHDFASAQGFIIVSFEEAQSKSFPKPLQSYIERFGGGGNLFSDF
ncbi:A/G-specific adenine glycosylase [Chryseobacterium sp. Leaf180]|uniref:A/G-specific adenine glycosylase n=1 Tax=Chryseobacterium sp. Leaf180 TaxID=1736289 RepID=UPI0006F48ED9|nr:A/G-specific adenine glycosylase [Chryseobacterium sp. Leaf180]KQR93338.1 A/G-specific adenine glycosylase [Chryseobacterium sp. Leaf180]